MNPMHTKETERTRDAYLRAWGVNPVAKRTKEAGQSSAKGTVGLPGAVTGVAPSAAVSSSAEQELQAKERARTKLA